MKSASIPVSRPILTPPYQPSQPLLPRASVKNTPIPFSYTLLLHRTAYIYCFLLPFGLVDSIGFMTPFVVAIVAYTFFGLDALGDEIEEPFGLDANDLPLDAICRAIEIDLLEAIQHAPLPAPMLPVGYRLT
jgi:putative membrane protein